MWLLDGDPAHAHLLQYALGPEAVGNTALLLTVAMTTPWDVLDQLRDIRLAQDRLADRTGLIEKRLRTILTES